MPILETSKGKLMYFLHYTINSLAYNPTFLTTGFCSFRSRGGTSHELPKIAPTQVTMAVEFIKQDTVSSEGQLLQEELE